MQGYDYQKLLSVTVKYLKTKNKILFLTTSNRWFWESGWEIPKSTLLAYKIQFLVWSDKVQIIDIPRLNIVPCEGNNSTKRGNTCGLPKALLKDEEKNPSGYHRCWASLNSPEDELWKVSKALFESDTVMFFGSIRWGQMNSFYQKLIERLTWVETRWTGHGEDNVLANIDAGLIVVNHNWRGQEVLAVQKQVLDFFGFSVRDELSWNWQYTSEVEDERDETYQAAYRDFEKTFLTDTK